jgi:hypothetical protein
MIRSIYKNLKVKMFCIILEIYNQILELDLNQIIKYLLIEIMLINKIIKDLKKNIE